MKVWAMGAKGLLGSALCQSLDRNGILYRGSSHHDADVTDPKSLERYLQLFGPFTHIVNCAAYTAVDLAESNIEKAWQLNVVAPANIGKLAQEKKMRVLHLSSDYVFDGLSAKPYLETDPTNPQTVYGKSKAAGEKNLLAILPNACILRTSWLFGSHGKNFVSSMLRLMQEKEEIKVVNDQRGRPTYAPDLAEVIIQALNWSGIYHAASSDATTWYDFAKEIHRQALQPLICKKLIPVSSEEFAARAKRPHYSVLDTQKIEKKLKPMRSWKEALKEYIYAIS
jgi:dTDP-4-dehydrorhamnose reductase